MRTEIFCFVYNRTDLLPRQLECFRRYFKGEYNLNVVCDYIDGFPFTGWNDDKKLSDYIAKIVKMGK